MDRHSSLPCPAGVLALLLAAALLAPVPAEAQHSGLVPPAPPATPEAGAAHATGVQQGAPAAFGPYYQWTSIFASQWQPVFPGGAVPLSNNTDYPYVCINPSDTSFLPQYWAQIELPNGAEVIYAYIQVKDMAGDANWTAWITGYESGLDSVVPAYTDYTNDSTVGTPGYAYLDLTLPDPVIIREYTDINNDGHTNLTAFALVLRSSSNPATTTDMCFFGGAVQWRRTVSPAPAATTFTDVPTNHWAFQFVEALVASGITAGCGGGNYCPDEPVTRAQMAVYLAAALGLHWPD